MDANTATSRLVWVDGPTAASLEIGVIDLKVTLTGQGWWLTAKIGWSMIVDHQFGKGKMADAKVYLMGLVNRWLFDHVDALVQATDLMMDTAGPKR